MLTTLLTGLLIPLFVAFLMFLGYQRSSLLLYPFPVAAILFFICTLWVRRKPQLRCSITKVVSLAFLTYATFSYGSAQDWLSFGLPQERVSSLVCILEEDSSTTESHKQILRVKLLQCQGKDGSAATAKGVLSVLCPVEEILPCGTVMFLKGRFTDAAFFIADEYQVRSHASFSMLRFEFLSHLERRLKKTISDGQVRSLASMLILGRSGDDAFPLKKLAFASGCSHLLALSGMHLGFISSLCSKIGIRLFGTIAAQWLSPFFPFVFVLAVGMKPSLIRALGMYFFSLVLGKGKLSSVYAYLFTGILQIWLWPGSLVTLGCLLSYLAYGALLLSSLFDFFLPKFLQGVKITMFALVFTAPVTILVNKTFSLASLLVTPIATILIMLCMYLSFLCLTGFPPFPFLLGMTYHALSSLLESFSSFEKLSLGWKGYGVLLLVLLTLFGILGYSEKVLQRTRREAYELELRLRFP